ncbi:class I SAM-dependent rRNA methyltransferase [Desulfurispora thermophila]|uniref:class I SAM-dependent rRNA methyltransferase n=1 Tax=Desulfurispora thermophila TaxID=265470 RepID=UPI0003648919|nr:class I SAM-dependent rRNA methyltransferase [Desulfurispora thermophila]
MPTVVLARQREQRVKDGHPWVYRTEIAEIKGNINPGDIVEVTDSAGRFVGCGFINTASQIAVRILTRDKNEQIDRNFFVRRIRQAVDYRRRVLENSNACRLIFGEADFLPALIVDNFAGYLSLQTLALGMDRFKDTIVDVLGEVCRPRGIFERNDASVRQLEGLPLVSGFIGPPFDPLVIIEENGLQLEVDLAGGQKTGYFLDQRENRRVMFYLAKGARVLDCFCHTGTFSVYAAVAGAVSVTGIDISAPALEVARRNAARNGVGHLCHFIEENCFDALRRLEREKALFDLIILDPPAFTKSKGALPGAVRGYKEINLRAMRLLPPGGFLVTCSCSYHMSEELFIQTIREAARDCRRQLRLVELRRQAKDHPMLLAMPENYYLKCLVIQVF